MIQGRARQLGFVARSLLTIMALSALLGCKVNSDDIEYWRRTVKGPRKIVAVLLSDHYSLELRTRAATALVEMERNDVEGLALLQRALEELQRQDPTLPPRIVAGMAPRLVELMNETPPGHNEEQGPPPMQVRAKDAAYLLLTHAEGETHTTLVNGVVDWYVRDFVGRSLAGNYSVEQIVRSVGAPAASRLVNALSSRMPQQAMVKIAELVAQLGDAATKTAGAERLVAIEREIEGEAFFNWLKGELQRQMTADGSTLDPVRLDAAVHINRENWITEGILPAMKHLATEASIKTRLLEIGAAVPAVETPPAFVEALNARRRKALQALEGNVSEANLAALLDIALNPSPTNALGVRDDAFDRVGDIRSVAAIPRLWPLLATVDNDDTAKRLRWRAGELILSIGGSAVVAEFLTRLPSAPADIEYEPEELEGYAQRMSQMSEPPTEVLTRQLGATQWWNRIIAMRFIERRGAAADAALLEARVSDRTPLAGDHWTDLRPAADTVGKVAEAALRGLRERLAGPEAAAAPAGAAPAAPAAPAPAAPPPRRPLRATLPLATALLSHPRQSEWPPTRTRRPCAASSAATTSTRSSSR
ncbi:MAG: hypothetical protein IPG17_14125 [Sandaracinaceae bacterium]|nr:hypothetical protein [Sandaracinaceae bacterium]MBK6809586.1 hypothetical protein [Sandaracinaceae bacterium]